MRDLSGSRPDPECSPQKNRPTKRNRKYKTDFPALQEKELLEAIKLQLQQKIDEAFEHLCVLQDLRQTMLTDLQNKNITLDIDVEQYNMSVDSNAISHKPHPTRRPKEYLLPISLATSLLLVVSLALVLVLCAQFLIAVVKVVL